MPLVSDAIKSIGLRPIAEKVGFGLSAIHKWKKQGRLPRTELAGLTQYAQAIEELSKGQFPAAELLAETREAWVRRSADR